MIFGYLQNSIEADNVYHPYSYESNIDNIDLLNENDKRAYEEHIKEFG